MCKYVDRLFYILPSYIISNTLKHSDAFLSNTFILFRQFIKIYKCEKFVKTKLKR